MLMLRALSTALAAVAVAAPMTGTAQACASRKPAANPQAFLEASTVAARDTVAMVSVCVVPAAGFKGKIGSYHGEIHFDSTSARVLRVTKGEGGVRVENATIPGRVNFAGAAPTGFANGTLVTVALRLTKAGSTPRVHLNIIELNTTEGTQLVKQLVVSPGS